MNILKVSDVYFPRVNGVSTSINTTRTTLHQLGHQTTLVAPAYPGHTETDDTILRIDARRVPFDPEDYLMKRRPLRKVMERLDREAFDIIHIHTPFMAHRFGVALSRHWRIPVVETYHTHFEEYAHHYIPTLPRAAGRALARWVARRLAAGVDGLVMPSSAIARSLHDYGVDTTMRVIPTGLDLNEFAPGDRHAFCRRFALDPARPSMVYVGRVAHEKNIGLLLDVVDRVRQQVPEVLLIIAGEGPALGSLQRQCKARGLGDNVVFVGYLKRGQPLWDCFAAGDLFAFASKTETQGLVLLEAMALGVPVVGYAAMGATEVLTIESGAAIVEGGADAFSEQVLTLLRDGERRAALAEKGKHYARTWSTQETTARLVDFYQSIIDEVTVDETNTVRVR